MSTRRAVVLQGKGVAKVRDNIPLPKLRDEYIIVTTKAVALNPADWKIIHDTHALAGGDIVNTISGCDYSGVVEEVGKAVTNELNVGDRVAGFIRGGEWQMPSSINTCLRIYSRLDKQGQWSLCDNCYCQRGYSGQDLRQHIV